MMLHVVGGWAYATAYLNPLAAALKPCMDVVPHPYHVEMAELQDEVNGLWVAGWSLGGLRLLNAVARGEISPRGLILISSTARFCADSDYTCGVTTSALRSMMIGIKRQRENTLHRFFSDSIGKSCQDQEIIERVQMAVEYNQELLLAGLHQLDTLDVRASLHAFRIPLLLLHGKQDAIIPPEASRYVHTHVSSGTQYMHPEAGHELPLDFPVWVGDQIANFINGTS